MDLYTLNGDFGQIVFEGGAGNTGSRYMSLSTEAALFFFKRISVLKSNIILNSLGLYSFAPLDNRGRVKFASLDTPKHLLRPASIGCSWNPIKGLNMQSSEMDSEGFEFQAEQCPDVFINTCFRQIYGTGNQVRDLMATPEGKALVGEMIERIYAGLGNSFADVTSFANHPLISLSDQGDWYSAAKVDDQEWANYYAQMTTKKIAGHQSIIHMLMEKGYEHLNVQIPRGDVSADGKKFIGDVIDLFERALDAQNPAMKRAAKGDFGTSNVNKGVILVSPSIFRAYEDYLLTEWKTIPQTFYYTLNSTFAELLDMEASTVSSGVLKYKGHVVVQMDEWDDFANQIGVQLHQIQVVTPRNFGVGLDVPGLDQFNGLAGLRMVQHLDAPWLGKIFMDTRFDLATGLVNSDFLTHGSLVIIPEVE